MVNETVCEGGDVTKGGVLEDVGAWDGFPDGL